MLSTVLVAIPLMAILTIIQTAVLPGFDFFDVTPSLPLLFALAWSLLSSVEEGVVWGFVGGLFMDTFTIAPVGGLALTYTLAIVATSFIRDLLPPNRFIIPVLLAVVATLVQQLLYLLYLRIFGISANSILSSLIQLVVLHAILIIPIYWFLNFIRRITRPSPVKI